MKKLRGFLKKDRHKFVLPLCLTWENSNGNVSSSKFDGSSIRNKDWFIDD
jgi:hypothetical protein